MNVLSYAKAVIAALVPILVAVEQAISTKGTISQQGWIAITIAVVGAIGVFAVPNRPLKGAAPK